MIELQGIKLYKDIVLTFIAVERYVLGSAVESKDKFKCNKANKN